MEPERSSAKCRAALVRRHFIKNYTWMMKTRTSSHHVDISTLDILYLPYLKYSLPNKISSNFNAKNIFKEFWFASVNYTVN